MGPQRRHRGDRARYARDMDPHYPKVDWDPEAFEVV
jgi:hypothetical protein